MRVAIFTSSDSITDKVLPILEETLWQRHIFVGTRIFPQIHKLEYLKSFGWDALKFGCKLRGSLKPTAKDPNLMVEWVKENAVDVIINLTGYFYGKEILEAPKIGVIGKHASLLPKDRGCLPVFWAMLNDEPVGVSVFKLTKKVDEGIVLSQRTIIPGKSLYENYQRIYELLPEMVIESLDNLCLPYRHLPTREEYRMFKDKGFSL